jgi:hypothetical protein
LIDDVAAVSGFHVEWVAGVVLQEILCAHEVSVGRVRLYVQ